MQIDKDCFLYQEPFQWRIEQSVRSKVYMYQLCIYSRSFVVFFSPPPPCIFDVFSYPFVIIRSSSVVGILSWYVKHVCLGGLTSYPG